jgi:hypothetical protein
MMTSDLTATAVDSSAMLGLVARLHQLLTDDDHLVGVPAVPTVYPDSRLRFDGPLDVAGANTLAEFSELLNRIPTFPVWSSTAIVHLWDVYGEILAADLAQSSLTSEEQHSYEAATAYLYETGANGSVPSAALRDYRSARQTWLQADVDYRQAQQAASMSADPNVRDQWTRVDEPRLRQVRDDAFTAWQTTGHKDQVEDALRELAELASKSPSATWKRHRDTFSPNLPDQYSTAPNGVRYAPTFYAPASTLDAPWSHAVLPRDVLLALVGQAPPEVTAALGGAIDDSVQSLAFDYSVVSVVRPWLDPFMELAGSRGWRLPDGAAPLSDGGDPPRGRCPAYVESVALARNLQITRRSSDPEVVSSGETALKGTWIMDLDNGVQGGDMFEGDIWWEQLTETSAQMTPGRRATIVNLGVTDFDGIGLNQLEPLVYGTTPIPGNPDASNQLIDGDVFAVMTSEGNFAKVLVVKYGYNMLIRWTTFRWSKPADTQSTTKPEDIYLAAFVCRRLPKCPDPDPSLSW